MPRMFILAPGVAQISASTFRPLSAAAGEFFDEIRIALSFTRPARGLPVGALSAKRVPFEIAGQMGVTESGVEIALPGFGDGCGPKVRNVRTVHPILRAKAQVAPRIQRDS